MVLMENVDQVVYQEPWELRESQDQREISEEQAALVYQESVVHL